MSGRILRAGFDGDGAFTEFKGAKLRRGVVAGGAEVGGDFCEGAALAGADLLRGSVDLRDGREERAGGQAVIDYMLVAVVIEEEDAGEDDDADEGGEDEEAKDAGEEAADDGSAGWGEFEFTLTGIEVLTGLGVVPRLVYGAQSPFDSVRLLTGVDNFVGVEYLGELGLDVRRWRHRGVGCGEAVEEFDVAFGQFFAYGDAVGDADEIGVFELDAGALVAVVEEDVEAGGGEVGGDLFGGFYQGGLL